jgi:hypothetical protein
MPQQGQAGGYNMHPSFGGFMNDPTAQLGFQMGKTAMDAGQQYVEQNVSFDPSYTQPLLTLMELACQSTKQKGY